jgi:hypothetical protein
VETELPEIYTMWQVHPDQIREMVLKGELDARVLLEYMIKDHASADSVQAITRREALTKDSLVRYEAMEMAQEMEEDGVAMIITIAFHILLKLEPNPPQSDAELIAGLERLTQFPEPVLLAWLEKAMAPKQIAAPTIQ